MSVREPLANFFPLGSVGRLRRTPRTLITESEITKVEDLLEYSQEMASYFITFVRTEYIYRHTMCVFVRAH